MGAALGVLSGLWSIFSALWSNPFTRVLLVGAVAYGYGFYKGDQHGDRQCAAGQLKATIARQQTELELARDQAESASKAAKELDKQRASAEERLRALQARLKGDPNSVYDADCRVVDPAGVRKPKPGAR